MGTYAQQLSSIPGRAFRGLLAVLLVIGAIAAMFALVIYEASPERAKAAWKAFQDPGLIARAEAAAARKEIKGKDSKEAKDAKEEKDSKPPAKPAEEEKVDKDSEGPQPPEESKADVVVYGRDTCSNTLAMRKALKKAGVSFRFASVDDKTGQEEYFEALRQVKRGKKEHVVLPVVVVDGQAFMHPSPEVIVEAAQGE